jgi:cytochrome c oxidase cbb3-type subunit 3
VRLTLPPLLAAALAVAGGCSRTPGDGAPPASPRPHSAASTAATPTSAAFERGRKIYNFRCYFCHGYSGNARTLATSYLAPPPRDFTAATPEQLPEAAIAHALRVGRPGTAMKSFAGILDESEIAAVAGFVAQEFVKDKARNTAYHTAENGWPAHERFAVAFPFVTGAVRLDTPWEDLSVEQVAGKRLFLSTCISCHDRAHVSDDGPAWSARPVSYPRAGFVFDPQATLPVDAISGASVYAKHDVAPSEARHLAAPAHGKALFEANCAFCHGADGSGKNWIGQFMEPPARDLRRFTPASMPTPQLVATIRDGLTNTSMPAWKDVLTATEIEAIADYVSRAVFQPDTPSVPATVASPSKR